MPWYSKIFHLSKATGNHDVLTDVCPRLGLRPVTLGKRKACPVRRQLTSWRLIAPRP